MSVKVQVRVPRSYETHSCCERSGGRAILEERQRTEAVMRQLEKPVRSREGLVMPF
jgi:hypothetical protein